MGNSLALGTFDGLHLGHQKVLSAVLPYNSIVITFNVPPKAVITNNTELLMTAEEKVNALKSFGIKQVEVLEFETVRSLEAKDFLNLICEKYKPSVISCGYNFHFGNKALGDTDILRQYCDDHSIKFICCESVIENGTAISSSYIRNLLKMGEIDKANCLLYKPFQFTTQVLHGEKRGRSIGFPTINQEYPVDLVKLKCGVYLSKIIVDNRQFYGVSNIGFRPTWKTENIISETYIKDFSDDLYGKNVTILPLKFLREEKVFSSINELKQAIANDIKAIEFLK